MFSLQANSQYSPIHLFLTKYTSPLCDVKGPCSPQEPSQLGGSYPCFLFSYFTPCKPRVFLFPDLVVEGTD